mmetsp:Transcript_18396/g.58642  ORF Transcript_18396/g.58642 Transcript_18396/m.58642 type:complete len:226 (+) Transcript_18396:1005-1682(+)
MPASGSCSPQPRPHGTRWTWRCLRASASSRECAAIGHSSSRWSFTRERGMSTAPQPRSHDTWRFGQLSAMWRRIWRSCTCSWQTLHFTTDVDARKVLAILSRSMRLRHSLLRCEATASARTSAQHPFTAFGHGTRRAGHSSRCALRSAAVRPAGAPQAGHGSSARASSCRRRCLRLWVAQQACLMCHARSCRATISRHPGLVHCVSRAWHDSRMWSVSANDFTTS